MIKKKQYKTWSSRFHEDYSKEPIVMQMELTYKCPIHCVHCYADCYNNAKYSAKELSTGAVKHLMNKLHDAGCLWFTFTGGDPMMRPDFTTLYDHAKDLGFIFSIMTSLAALNDKILSKMREKPPFSIDMTLNGVTEKTYENISQVRGSFKKVMKNIDRVLEAGLPLKIKTLVSKNNIHEVDEIKKFVESKGGEFSPSTLIFARLDGSAAPCAYRLPVRDVVKMSYPDAECGEAPDAAKDRDDSGVEMDPTPNRFYRCAIGYWQWHINPRGHLNICSCVRKPSYDLVKGSVQEGIKKLADYIKNKNFSKDFECRSCKIWHLCHFCPGKAELELGDEEKVIPYFCELAKFERDVLKKCIVEESAVSNG